MSTAEPRYCYRHPDRETGLSCSDCGRAGWAACAPGAPGGVRCPQHASGRRGPATKIRPRPVRRAPGIALATGVAPITRALIGINVVVYLITVVQGPGGLNSPGGSVYVRWVLYGPLVAHGGWYRLVSAMFLHASIVHIAFNMFALWVIGRPVEQYLGPVRYVGLYLVSGLAGSAGALLQAPLSPTVGASGAIFGILGAMVILEWQVTGQLAGQAMSLVAINLVISFLIPGISWGGHVGGLIGGILIMLAYAHWSDRGRAQYGQIGIPGLIGLFTVAAASVAIAYFRVRGYA
jgi:membrane associated rhomboid family serine protease